MNVLLIVSYRGTHYHGFQVQQNALTVCEVLQDAMQVVFSHRPDVKGCSRTDAGVHARGYALNVVCETRIKPEKIPLALNAHLPQDIRVQTAQVVPRAFHARYSVTEKEYSYLILNAPSDDPLMEGLYYRVSGVLDVSAMQAAADVFCGRHDFSSFCSAGAKPGEHTRTITRFEVQRRGDWVKIRVAADGFLYNMVRILAGTLLLAGQRKKTRDEFEKILIGRDRRLAGPTLPAKGLCLEKVFYPPTALCLLPEEF